MVAKAQNIFYLVTFTCLLASPDRDIKTKESVLVLDLVCQNAFCNLIADCKKSYHANNPFLTASNSQLINHGLIE
jgi:hypothetical protein